MIGVIGKHIHDEILFEINTAKCYSVISDEVTDISNKKQLSITIWYFLGNDVKERYNELLVRK